MPIFGRSKNNNDDTQPIPKVKGKGAGGKKAKDSTAPLLGPAGRAVEVQTPECERKGHNMVASGSGTYNSETGQQTIPTGCSRTGCNHTGSVTVMGGHPS